MNTHSLQTIIEAIVPALAYVAYLIMGYSFYFLWVVLMLLGRELVKTDSFSLKRFARALVISAPLAVLAASAAAELWDWPEHVNAFVACIAGMAAQKFLEGDWVPKLFDVLLDKLRGSGQ